MHRVDHATADPTANGASKPGFTDGDPGLSISPTTVPSAWLNNFQEEFCLFLEAQGITLSAASSTQFQTAMSTFKHTAFSQDIVVAAAQPGIILRDTTGSAYDVRFGVESNFAKFSIDSDSDAGGDGSGHFDDVPNFLIFDLANASIAVNASSSATRSRFDITNTTNRRSFNINTWLDASDSSGGFALFASNAYYDTAGSAYRFSNTSPTIGAAGITFNTPNWNEVGIFCQTTASSTAGSSFTPDWRMVFTATANVTYSDLLPNTNNTKDLGSSTLAYAEIWGSTETSHKIPSATRTFQFLPSSGNGISTLGFADGYAILDGSDFLEIPLPLPNEGTIAAWRVKVTFVDGGGGQVTATLKKRAYATGITTAATTVSTANTTTAGSDQVLTASPAEAVAGNSYFLYVETNGGVTAANVGLVQVDFTASSLAAYYR